MADAGNVLVHGHGQTRISKPLRINTRVKEQKIKNRLKLARKIAGIATSPDQAIDSPRWQISNRPANQVEGRVVAPGLSVEGKRSQQRNLISKQIALHVSVVRREIDRRIESHGIVSCRIIQRRRTERMEDVSQQI